MPLTVKDILEKTFKRSFKGYDENEVDKFLDEIIDEIKALQNDNAALKEALDAQIERAKKTKDSEEAIMHTLVSAQKSAERILAEAAKKAEVIIDSAETTATKRAQNTVKELGEAQRKLEEVKNSAKLLARRFNDLLNNESASFEKVFKNYFGEIEGGINVKALEKIDEDITESLKGINEEPERRAETRRRTAERPFAEEPFTEESFTEEPFIERPAPRPAIERPAPRPAMERPAPKPAPRIEEERPAPRYMEEERPAPKFKEEERPVSRYTEEERPAPKYTEEERPAPRYNDEERPAPKYTEEERPAPKNTKEERPISETPFPEEIINANDYDFEVGSGKMMELTEINKVLSEIENSGEDILQENYDTQEIKDAIKKKDNRPTYNSIYDDYSWLYGNEEKEEPETNEPGVVFKDPKDKEELESLIDDIIDNKGI